MPCVREGGKEGGGGGGGGVGGELTLFFVNSHLPQTSMYMWPGQPAESAIL